MRWGRSPAGRAGQAAGQVAAEDLSVAAVTMVRDEGRMLPKWLAHYGAAFGAENLVVIDDNTADGSTRDLPCSVLRLPSTSGRHFERMRMGVVSGVAAALLEVHDAVLFCDADEFIVADPARHASLRHFLAARPEDEAFGVMGLNVVHHLASEAPLDLTRPLLEQRSAVKLVPLMCKPSLKRTTAPWRASSHGIEAEFAIEPDLYMFHFKFADLDHLAETAAHRRALVDDDGRAAETNWALGADAMVDLLRSLNADLPADPADLPEFTPPKQRRREAIIRRVEPDAPGDPVVVRATGTRQMRAMAERPAARIPDRFRGLL